MLVRIVVANLALSTSNLSRLIVSMIFHHGHDLL
jgi:hypothetical protein